MMDIDSMLAVLQAAKEGKKIECRSVDGIDPWRYTSAPNWDFYHVHFRVKPEPREWWIVDCASWTSNYRHAHSHAQEALLNASAHTNAKVIHVREVLD